MSVGKDKMAPCQEESKSETSTIKAGESKFKEKNNTVASLMAKGIMAVINLLTQNLS
jgi:hypothetical protein